MRTRAPARTFIRVKRKPFGRRKVYHGGLAVMNIVKILLILLAIALVGVGAVALFGVVAALLKWVVVFGVIALAGVGAYKLFAGPDRDEQAALSPAEAEMLKAERLLADLRRKELTK